MRHYTAALSKIPLAITSVFLAACGDYDPAADEGEWALGEPELGAIRQESICGATTDWQDVEVYDGTLGPTTSFVAARQRQVGQVSPIGCTGTMITRDLFLTAGHCIDDDTVTEQVVRFNYQNDPSGNPRTPTSYSIIEVVEWVDEPKVGSVDGMDYAILRLASNPGDTWGITVPAMFAFPAGHAITIIQHPDALPKKVEGGTLGYDANDGEMTYGDLDTIGGTSGSGILSNASGNVIGVHTRGVADGTCSATDPNGGWPMDLIWDWSTVLRPLLLDSAKVSIANSVSLL